MGDTPHYTRQAGAAPPRDPAAAPFSPAPPGDLPTLLAAIQARWGIHALRPLRQLAPPPRLPSGYPALDAALGGGWPTGRLTVLSSRLTCGATALACAGLRAGQTAGRELAILDPWQRFDPASAVAGGLALDRLLLLRPTSEAEAFALAGRLAQTRGLGGLIWLGAPPQAPGWAGLAAQLAGAPLPALALVYGPLPPASALAHSAAAAIVVRRQAWLHQRGDVVGVRAHISRPDGQVWGETTLRWEAG